MRDILGLKPIVLDFETYYDKETGYTLKKMPVVNYVRDSRFKCLGVGYSVSGGETVWASEPPALDWSKTAVVAHNAKFDGLILEERFGIKPALYVDTLAMSRAVNGASLPSHSLRTLALHYGLPEKGDIETDDLEAYCKHDVNLTCDIFELLRDEFPESEYDMMDWSIKCFVRPQLQLNVPVLEQAEKDECGRRESFFTSQLARVAPRLVHPKRKKRPSPKEVFASNKLFPRLLQRFGYEVPMKNSPAAAKRGETKLTPALSVGDTSFIKMHEGGDERLHNLCEARIAAKSALLETRAGKFAAAGKTGLWPFDVEYSGAQQTHRFSGGSGGGGNPQNLPSKNKGDRDVLVLREAVEPKAGSSLCVGDFANIELRVLAWLSQDKGLMGAIAEGQDVYCQFGTRYFGREITKENKDERNFSKAAVLGLGYGMGAKKFAHTVKVQTGKDLPKEEAEAAVMLYRSMYGAVPAFWAYMQDLLPLMANDKNGHLYSLPAVKWDKRGFVLPSGLRIKYPNLRTEPAKMGGRPEWIYDAYRSGRKDIDVVRLYGGKMTENLCQGLAGEICKEAIRSLYGRPCGMVHDELLIVSDKPEVAKQYMEQAMSKSPKWWPEINLGCEVNIGSNWREAK